VPADDEARLAAGASSGSTAATTTWTSAMPPLVMKIFWPLITHSPFLRTARVFIEETSEPASVQ